LSWQIAPIALEEMLKNGDDRQRKNVTEAYMAMKKFDLKALERAYRL
jgi:predicted 3-demethylubiquinone-9 3-methyltransferase (glyoxalase superfamily)